MVGPVVLTGSIEIAASRTKGGWGLWEQNQTSRLGENAHNFLILAFIQNKFITILLDAM